MKPRLLDLFCCAGGSAMGYHRAGFEVVGVDCDPQPRFPFRFVRADALAVLSDLLRGMVIEGVGLGLADFDAIHASPPCQRYSRTRKIRNDGDRHPDLIGPTRKLLQSSGRPWVMENVPGSPLERPVVLCGLMFGLKVLRHRLFETNWLLPTPPHPKHPRGDLTGSWRGHSTGANGYVTVAGHIFVREAAATAMGIDWMKSTYELAQAIPPAYSEWIGRQLMEAIR